MLRNSCHDSMDLTPSWTLTKNIRRLQSNYPTLPIYSQPSTLPRYSLSSKPTPLFSLCINSRNRQQFLTRKVNRNFSLTESWISVVMGAVFNIWSDGAVMVKITTDGSLVRNFKNALHLTTGWLLGANWLNLCSLFVFTFASQLPFSQVVLMHPRIRILLIFH